MIDSFKSMPYTKYDAVNNYIETDNPFTNGKIYFRELEEGLWIMITEIAFKKNVSTHALYDKGPCEYYFLSYFRYTHKISDVLMNEISVPTVGWGLYKPGTAINTYFGANDEGVFMDIVFSKTWFEKNILLEKMEDQNSLKRYLASDKAYKIWRDMVVGSSESADKILGYLKEPKSNNINQLSLKIGCLDLMMRFLESIASMNLSTEKEDINNTDRSHLATAERLLVNSLNTGFPGIKELAKAVHMSPTKLKTLFKKVYGKSIFEYYQEKQMQLALNLLKRANMSVKEVSHTMGYNNHSNFTTAFKKYYNYLPSEVTKDA